MMKLTGITPWILFGGVLSKRLEISTWWEKTVGNEII
jgi:hypothetical protein